MTHGRAGLSESEFTIDLDGEDSSANVVCRGVARDKLPPGARTCSINGNARCYGHSECDSISSWTTSYVQAIPEITANSVEASLVHEAAIGKIAGEQISEAHDPRPHRGRSRRADSRRLPEVSPEGGTMSPPSSPPPGAAERSERVLRKKRKKVLTNGTRRAIIIKPTRERPPARPENTASMGV